LHGLELVHVDIWVLLGLHHLEVINTLSLL